MHASVRFYNQHQQLLAQQENGKVPPPTNNKRINKSKDGYLSQVSSFCQPQIYS